MRFPKSGFGSFGIGVLALAGGCHLIVGIRDAEPYPPDAGMGGMGGAAACAPSQTQDCYGGPEQTEGVGVCKSGTQTCQADGEWGPCEGEVRPGTEDCSATEDEDCSGYACGETLWVRQFGDQSTEAYTIDIAVDPRTDDIYFTGSVQGSLPIGSETLDSQGTVRFAFLAKLDRDGTPLWAKQFGQINDLNTVGTSVGVDAAGNVVLAGTTHTTVNLGESDLPPGVFVGKFAPSGQHLWSMACQSDDQPYPWPQAAVDPSSGDVVIAGYFGQGGTGSINCGDFPLAGTSDVFVARLAGSDGSVLFSMKFGGTGQDYARSVAVDAQGSIFLTGTTTGEGLNFGGPLLTGGYVVKLAANGSHVWSKAIGAGSPWALALDADGGPAVTGYGLGTGALNFGGEDLAPVGSSDLFVARLDGSGNHVWSRRFGSPGTNVSWGADVALDGEGNLAIAGNVDGNVPIGDAVLVGDDNAYVIKFDVDGSPVWSKTFGADETYDVAFSSLNELVVGGQSSVAADFGEGLVNPVGESDLFLLKIAP